MATLSTSVRFRPVRLGLLVRENSLEDILKAASLNTLLWGGVHNPLIPVTGDGALAKRLIDLFAVDVLMPIAPAPEVESLLGEYSYLRDPHHADGLFYEDWDTKKKVLAYLDAINIIDRYWWDEFRHKPRTFKSNCRLVSWDSADPLAGCFAVDFGLYPSDQNLRYDFRKAFVNGLRAKEITLPLNGAVDAAVATHITPLALTEMSLTGYGVYWRSESGIYLGDEDNPKDLLTFWNIRAAGAHVLFVPRRHVERYEAVIKAHLKWLDREGRTRARLRDVIAIYYGQCPENDARHFADQFGTKAQKLLSHTDDVSWNGLNIRPTAYYLSWDHAIATAEESFGKPVVTMALPDKKFLAEGREERRDLGTQALAVSLDFYGDLAHPEHTLKPPFLRALNEFYGRQITVDFRELRVEREGIAVLRRVHDTSIHLYPLPHQALVERIFELAGVEAKMSQAGRLAGQIIKGMREFSPLDACRVFKVRGVRRFLAEAKADTTIPWDQALRTVGQTQFARFKDLYIESRRKRDLEPADVLIYLLKKRILVPRVHWWHKLLLRRVPFACLQCGLRSLVLRSAFEGNWRCPYCEREHYLPEEITATRALRGGWKLKRAGLFARDNNQEGALPVILTLLVLLRLFDLGRFIYSTALSLSLGSGKHCETDFAVLQYREQKERIEVGIGECKADKGRITAQDVANLKAVQERLHSIGIRAYLVFAKTADEFYPEELELFRGLRTEGVPVVLFTNRELEPYNPYWEKEAETLPVRYPFTFADLARNSEARYLKATP